MTPSFTGALRKQIDADTYSVQEVDIEPSPELLTEIQRTNALLELQAKLLMYLYNQQGGDAQDEAVELDRIMGRI